MNIEYINKLYLFIAFLNKIDPLLIIFVSDQFLSLTISELNKYMTEILKNTSKLTHSVLNIKILL
jgi:hypothetical protein